MKQSSNKLPLSEPDFHLIGIASHENDYRLAWAINNSLGLSLSKTEDVIVFHDTYKQNIQLSVYQQEFPEYGYQIKLFTNKGDNFFLLENLKNIDFFLKLEGEIQMARLAQITTSLKNVDIIMGVFPIDLKTLKKNQRLMF